MRGRGNKFKKMRRSGVAEKSHLPQLTTKETEGRDLPDDFIGIEFYIVLSEFADKLLNLFLISISKFRKSAKNLHKFFSIKTFQHPSFEDDITIFISTFLKHKNNQKHPN